MSVNVADIIKIMEEIAPPAMAENWDNVGLMLGRRCKACLLYTSPSPRDCS